MEAPTVMSIDWSSINIWCCGRFFSSVEIIQHSIESHPSRNDENHNEVESIQVPENRKNKTDMKAMKPLHSCEMCKKSFHDKKIFSMHLKLHKKGGKVGQELLIQKKNKASRYNFRKKCSFPSDICGKSFSQKSNLNIHKLSHNASQKRRTPYRKLAWRPLRNDTKATKSSPVKTQPVVMPSDDFTGVQPLENSEPQVIYESIQISKLKTKLKEVNIRNVKEVNIRNGVFPHNWDICCKPFLRKGALQIHEKMHNNEKHFSCEICGESFKKNISCIIHMQVKHSQLDSKTSETINENLHFKCEICNKEFGQKSFLELHQKINHHEVKLGPKKIKWSERCVKSAIGVVKKEEKLSLDNHIVEEHKMEVSPRMNERIQPKEPVTVKEQISNAFGFDDSTDDEIDGGSLVTEPGLALLNSQSNLNAGMKVEEKRDAPFRFIIGPSTSN